LSTYTPALFNVADGNDADAGGIKEERVGYELFLIVSRICAFGLCCLSRIRVTEPSWFL
jgi:hypothetical protein